MTLGTLFEQTGISLPQGWSMLIINVFLPVVHEKKIFEDLSKCALFCLILGSKGARLFIWTYLKTHRPSKFPTKFGWNWWSCSWEEVV